MSHSEGFDFEARFLRSHFGHLGNGGSAYVLGDMFNGLQVSIHVCNCTVASGCAPFSRSTAATSSSI